jgi:hypothetical protein
MTSTPPKGGPRGTYRLFAFAAAIYMAGVVAFSAWSYYQHRAIVENHIDEMLIHAAYATEQILGREFIEHTVETDAINRDEYLTKQDKLTRFAENCRLDALGAATRRGSEIRNLIAGIGNHYVIPPDDIHYRDRMPDALSSIIRELAESATERIRVQNLQHEDYGQLRIAIHYHAVSDELGYALIVARNTGGVNELMRAQALSKMANGLFLLAMAFPLIALFNSAQIRASKKMATLNERLKQDMEKQKEHEAELKDAIRDLERFNAVAVGRENRIIELKAEINTLLEQMNRTKRYNVGHVE